MERIDSKMYRTPPVTDDEKDPKRVRLNDDGHMETGHMTHELFINPSHVHMGRGAFVVDTAGRIIPKYLTLKDHLALDKYMHMTSSGRFDVPM